VLTPDEALKTFFLPPGYGIELVASEPLVQEPVALDWDTEGRLWVVEMPGWMPDITATGEHDAIGRVVVLEDTNADGRMDKRTIFADKLILARSLKVLDRGVLVGEPPHAWFMRDTNGDLRMDAKELVTDRYGRLQVDPQNNANGFHWAIDNTLYTAGQSDIQFRMKDGKFEVFGTLRRGEWGVTHDDAGRIYRNTNESALHVDLVPTFYYARNPNLLRTRGSYDRLADDNYQLNTVWPVRPNPGTNRAYQTGIDRADGSLARFTSVCAPVVYRGDRLPADLYGNVFVAEPAANVVSRIVLEEEGGMLRARKAYDSGEFLASTDERFRPVFISNAPDGTLYIADLYRGIIEHRISITSYLRDQILSRQLERPTGLGRIYRVVHESTRRDLSFPLAKASPAELVDALAHPNGWHRDAAQRLLVERGLTSMAQPLMKLFEGAKDWRTRIHALWTLDGLDTIRPELVMKALDDAAAEVRVGAVRIAERWAVDPDHRIHAALVRRIDDRSWSVRRQLAASMGAIPPGTREPAIVSLLERYATDPVVLDAALSSLRGREAVALERVLKAGPDPTPQREAAITMISATLVRGGQDATIQTLFASAANERHTEWQRSAILRGAEVALLGAAMPAPPRDPRGAAPAAASSLPCPTCPGGRAGPGGAYAFPRPENWPTSSGGRGAGPMLRLSQEPVALSDLAKRSDDLAPRASALLGRIAWPGKPGDGAGVTPLSPEEQQRFDAGRAIYQNLCQACHQPDGRGQEKIAPSLIGSAMTLAPADIPVRVLLNGKEGPIGLMPPVGGALNDEQVAGVLTYVRREWGHTGSPVDAATVARIRAQTTSRTRPWTNDELKALEGK
jgi:mono/diheme cytochrome c family protein